MRKIAYLFILFAIACSNPLSVDKKKSIIPDIPGEMPKLQSELQLPTDSFTTVVNVEYMNDTAFVSGLPQGVRVQTSGAHVAVHSSVAGVEYRLSGASDDGSFELASTQQPLLSFSSLKLLSRNKNTISVVSPGVVFLRSIGRFPSYLMDGIPGDTVCSPNDAAAVFVDGTAVLASGNIAMRGERRHAIYCTGEFAVTGANISIEAARENALVANEGVVIASGYVQVKATKDAMKSQEGNMLMMQGDVNLQCLGEQGDAVQANNIYMYGGNLKAVVRGDAARGLNMKASAYLLGGMLDVASSGGAIYSPQKQEYIAAACIKTNKHLYIDNAFVLLRNSGNGGRGVVCGGLMQMDNGTLLVENNSNDIVNDQNPHACTAAKGIICDSSMLIRGGLVEVLVYGKGEHCEGIESKGNMTITGKSTTIYVYAYDDAVNCGASFLMNDGRLYVYSVTNDAIDSNGSLTIAGGLLIANGGSEPEQGLAVCDDARFAITGGTLVATGGCMGPSPAVPLSDASTQSLAACTGMNFIRGKYISVQDDAGRLLCAYRLPRSMEHAVFTYSSPSLTDAGSYTLSVCDTVVGARHLGNGLFVDGGNGCAIATVSWRQDALVSVFSMSGKKTDADGRLPAPSHDRGSGNGSPLLPEHAKRHDAMPPHMPHADTEGYSGRNLPGGGWLPERL